MILLVLIRMDSFCLIDQAHELADQNIPLLVHQLVTHVGKFQRVLCKNQVSLGRKGIRVHSDLTPLAYSFMASASAFAFATASMVVG